MTKWVFFEIKDSNLHKQKTDVEEKISVKF